MTTMAVPEELVEDLNFMLPMGYTQPALFELASDEECLMPGCVCSTEEDCD